MVSRKSIMQTGVGKKEFGKKRIDQSAFGIST